MPHKDPEARKRYLKEHYLKNREKILAKMSEYRAAKPEQIAASKKRCYERVKDDPEFKKRMSDYGKARRAKNREHVREIERKSYYKNHSKRLAALYAQANTPERKAREKVQQVIRSGAMPPAKELVCVRCGGQARDYHHHKGYAREHWLSVIPVCSPCHKAIHAEEESGSFGSHST